MLKNFGVGVDIESIARFKESEFIKNKAFLDKIFTEKELDYSFANKSAAPHLAARFAGKEAVIKALGDMLEFTPDYKEIEILNNEKGIPLVTLKNDKFNEFQAKISLSHCDDKALAFAIVTRL